MICRDVVHSVTGRLPGMEGAKARLWRQGREARCFEQDALCHPSPAGSLENVTGTVGLG